MSKLYEFTFHDSAVIRVVADSLEQAIPKAHELARQCRFLDIEGDSDLNITAVVIKRHLRIGVVGEVTNG